MSEQPIPEAIYDQCAEDAAKIVTDMINQDRDPLLIGITGGIMLASVSKCTGLGSFTYTAANGQPVRITIEREGDNDA